MHVKCIHGMPSGWELSYLINVRLINVRLLISIQMMHVHAVMAKCNLLLE